MIAAVSHYIPGIFKVGYGHHGKGSGAEGAMAAKAGKAGKVAHLIKTMKAASKSAVVHYHKKPNGHHHKKTNGHHHHKKAIGHHHKKPIVHHHKKTNGHHHKKPIVATKTVNILKKKPIVKIKKFKNLKKFMNSNHAGKIYKGDPMANPTIKPHPPFDPGLAIKIIAAYAAVGITLTIGVVGLHRHDQNRNAPLPINRHQNINPLNPANQTELPQIIVEDDAICGVCLNNINPGQYICRFLCGHMYHYHGCARRWLQRERTCPTCRSRVNRFDRSEAAVNGSDAESETETD